MPRLSSFSKNNDDLFKARAVKILSEQMDQVSATSDDTISALSSTVRCLSSVDIFPDDAVSARVLSMYDNQELLGKGSFGKVFHTFLQLTNGNRVEVAVKKVRNRDETEREVEALRALQGHPNIVKLYKVEDTDKYKFIFQELCQGTLEDAVKRQDLAIPEIEVLRQITNAIDHIHRKGFVHKDLKAENILIQRSSGTAIYKLADFGLCRKLERGDQYSMCTSGNKAHKPPEVLLEQERQRKRTESFGTEPEEEDEHANTVSGTAKVDIFGLGCIFYYVLTKGKHPFEKKGKYDYNILNNKYSLKDIEDDVEAHHVIQKMISQVPSERPPASAVLMHPFFLKDFKYRANILQLTNIWSNDSALCATFPESRLLRGVSWLAEFDEDDLSRLRLNSRASDIDSSTVRSLARGFAQGLKCTGFEECLQLFQKNVPGCFLELWMVLLSIENYNYNTVRSELQKAVELNKERAVEDLVEDEDVNFQSLDGKTALHLAVQTSTDRIINLLLDRDARWDIADEIGWTPLHYAVQRNLHTVELLLNTGHDLGEAHKTGWTPLHIAASLGLDDVVSYLLDQCTGLATAKDSEGQTPLHVAANSAVVKELFELRKTEVDALDHLRRTPLHLACARNSRDVAACLVEKKAAIDAKNMANTTPLHTAVQFSASECAFLLLENGADTNAQDGNGAFPLLLAATNNHKVLLKELILRNADVNMSDKWGNTALHDSAYRNHAEVASILINSRCSVVARNCLKETALHFAARTDAVEAATILAKYKDLVNFTDARKRTPLHTAASFNAHKVAKLLISRRAKTSARDINGGIPLHYAAARNSFTVANLLVKEVAHLVKANNGENALHVAAGHNSVEVASLLVEKFGDVNEQTGDKIGFAPLHFAALEGALDVAKLLLDKGAAVDQRSRLGLTPLHASVLKDSVNVAALLLEKGADVNAVHLDTGKTTLHLATEHDGKVHKVTELLLQNQNINLSLKCHGGYTPLLEAARRNAQNTAKLLLEAGAEVNQAHDENKYTAIHIASVNNFASMAKILIEYKADVNAKCGTGHTPLLLAAARNAIDVIQVLIDNKVDVNASQCVNTSDGNQLRLTSLQMAAQCNSKAAVQLLLNNGADVNAKTEDGITPLLQAILHNSVDVVETILHSYSSVTEATEKNIHEKTGYTPLYIAVDTRNKRIAELLLQKGACVNSSFFPNGNTALHAAIVGRAKETVQLLLKHGADVNAANNTGLTPLHFAATADSVDLVELLFKSGASLSQADHEGTTALHESAKYNSLESAKFLLTHKLNPNVADNNGLTPLHVAVRNRSLEVFRLLLNKECDVDCKDATGQVPLHCAVFFGLEEYVKLLLIAGANPDIQDDEGNSPWSLAAIRNETKICSLFAKSTNKRI